MFTWAQVSSKNSLRQFVSSSQLPPSVHQTSFLVGDNERIPRSQLSISPSLHTMAVILDLLGSAHTKPPCSVRLRVSAMNWSFYSTGPFHKNCEKYRNLSAGFLVPSVTAQVIQISTRSLARSHLHTQQNPHAPLKPLKSDAESDARFTASQHSGDNKDDSRETATTGPSRPFHTGCASHSRQ